ncbi:MAG TPA: hypothetical protein VD861_00325 [Pyrinomonadaceae bacterium]|nr:hypothetical protein [Pyrinomonadaceae bacterium]
MRTQHPLPFPMSGPPRALAYALAALLCALAPGVARAAQQADSPVIDGVVFREVSVTGNTVNFTLEINGNNFGNNAADLTAVQFTDATGAQVGTVVSQQLTSNNKIVVRAQAPVNITISGVRVTTRGQTIESSSFRLSLKPPAPPPAVRPFEIKHATRSSPGSPIKSLLVTNEEGRFASSPHRMSVEILPAGASNILVRPASNPYQMVVDFVAPERFEVQDVIITVYDSGDLETRQPVAVAQPFREKKPPADPNQPSITRVDILYIQRDKGIGRFKIEGSGFGNYRLPPMTAEEYLRCCGSRSAVGASQAAPADWRAWQDEVERAVKVALVPRNPTFRVERSEIVYIDDKLIDLYVEFTLFPGYSQPFRAASTTVTVRKPGAKPLQVMKGDGVVATVEGPETYIASREVGPKRDENLTYEYTVLDMDQAASLFGNGISKNFYAVKLSVVNRGEKKVSIPLASIQAEIEWANGPYKSGKPIQQELAAIEYLEGQETQTPIPLEDVSGFFDAYIKSKGRKAQFFNVLSGITTLGASLIPFVGPGVKDAHVVFTGGLIPGLRQGLGDLSGQQLQNLTARTWETVEVISDRGGSISKYVFFQRGEQVFSGQVEPNVRKLIMNIRGIEVTGFEVIESEPKAATQQ